MRRRGDQGGTPQTPAYISVALGSAYFRTNAFADAEREWRAALQVDPKLGEAHNNLAVVLMLTGRLDEAERELELAEKSGPPRQRHVQGGSEGRESGQRVNRRLASCSCSRRSRRSSSDSGCPVEARLNQRQPLRHRPARIADIASRARQGRPSSSSASTAPTGSCSTATPRAVPCRSCAAGRAKGRAGRCRRIIRRSRRCSGPR